MNLYGLWRRRLGRNGKAGIPALALARDPIVEIPVKDTDGLPVRGLLGPLVRGPKVRELKIRGPKVRRLSIRRKALRAVELHTESLQAIILMISRVRIEGPQSADSPSENLRTIAPMAPFQWALNRAFPAKAVKARGGEKQEKAPEDQGPMETALQQNHENG
jgi:hypothetical protein